MTCEAHGASAAAPDRSSALCRLFRTRGLRGWAPDAGRSALGDRRSMGVVWSPEEGCQCRPQRDRAATSIPVSMAGTLVGAVEGPSDPQTPIRVLLRDARRAVVREYHPALSQAGHVRARFDLRGLAPDTYTLEVWAPGFCPERRDDVRIEPSCVTDTGTIYLTRAHLPGIPALVRHLGSRPLAAVPRVAWSGWALGGSS